MSAHAKLQKARVMLQQTPMKKSGANKHHGFTYFELADFLPTIQKIFLEVGLMGQTTFDSQHAILTIYDVEKPESSVFFRSPVADAVLNKASPIQQLGAQHTYLRRYLWLMAMEIVENDVVDAQEQVEPPPRPKKAMSAEGKPGPWQMRVSTDVEGGIANWIAGVDSALELLLSMATSVTDVNEIYRVNRAVFDTLKGEDDVAYAKMLAKFSAAKKKMEE
jgi:hypothetical protein